MTATGDRLDEQRQFREEQRAQVERAQRMPVEQARARLRELADRERAFLASQQHDAHRAAQASRRDTGRSR